LQEIHEGEEVLVNYIIVEARFMDRSARQARLRDGWGFRYIWILFTSLIWKRQPHALS
jgi:hypothetical protein